MSNILNILSINLNLFEFFLSLFITLTTYKSNCSAHNQLFVLFNQSDLNYLHKLSLLIFFCDPSGYFLLGKNFFSELLQCVIRSLVFIEISSGAFGLVGEISLLKFTVSL